MSRPYKRVVDWPQRGSARRRGAQPLQWRFYLGACFLTGAIVVPQAGILPALGGMVLAGLILLAWSWLRSRDAKAPGDES